MITTLKRALIFVCVLGFILVNLPCAANGERALSRYKGRALKFGIPLYQGTPPEEYKYKSLGSIEGKYTSGFFDSAVFTASNALEDLATKAKTLNANAVIKIESESKGMTFIYQGEAVVFENLPEE